MKDDRVLAPIAICAIFEMDSVEQRKIKKYQCYADISALFVNIGLDITADEQGNAVMVPRKST